MSSIPDIGDQPIEHDPTGVRALLGALPDPGPMPAELIARIEFALAAEAADAARTETDAEPETDAEDRTARVIPFAAGDATSDDGILRGQTRQERRRVVLPWLAAAAVAGIVTVSGTNLLHDHGSSIAAAFGGGNSSSAGSAAMQSTAAESLRAGSGGDTSKRPGSVAVQRSGAAYTSAGLAAEAATLAPDPSKSVPVVDPESPATGAYGTALGVRDCASKHGVDPAAPIVADLGNIDGTPGFVVVAGSGTSRTAYAFSMACTVLAGPVHVR